MKLSDKDRLVLMALLALLLACGLGTLAMIGTQQEGGAALLESFLAEPTPEPTPSPTPAPTPTPTPTPEPTPAPEPSPALRERTELLILVNPWNQVPEGYEPELEEIEEDMWVDVRCAQDLRDMMADCRAAGNAPYICSAYRDLERQKFLYNNKIRRLVLEGTDPELAPDIAAMSVARPNTSEHQLGLAVDIIHYYYTNLDEGQEDTSTQQWLMENSWRYGFILRYPNGTSDITGIIYEPWHYRYVGHEAAEEIYQLGITLEEYLDTYYEPIE